MTYLYYLGAFGSWVGVVFGALILIACVAGMFLSLPDLFDGDGDAAKMWLIGFPVVFFGAPGWWLLLQVVSGGF